MTISNLEGMFLALLPGTAESMQQRANNSGNLVIRGLAKEIKLARNGVYIGVALTIITFLGSVLTMAGGALFLAFSAFAILSASLTIFVARKLYSDSALLLQSINQTPSWRDFFERLRH